MKLYTLSMTTSQLGWVRGKPREVFMCGLYGGRTDYDDTDQLIGYEDAITDASDWINRQVKIVREHRADYTLEMAVDRATLSLQRVVDELLSKDEVEALKPFLSERYTDAQFTVHEIELPCGWQELMHFTHADEDWDWTYNPDFDIEGMNGSVCVCQYWNDVDATITQAIERALA